VDFWPAVLAAATADDDDDDDADDASIDSAVPAWWGLLGTLELFSKTAQQLNINRLDSKGNYSAT